MEENMQSSIDVPEVVEKRQGDVLWLIFNRPKALNSMTRGMEDILIHRFRAVNDDKSIKALIVTGAPGKKPSFMAGQDFSCLQGVSTIDDFLELERRGEDVLEALENVRIPTLAAMAGAAVGGGALIAAACDVRIASSSLRFGCPIAKTAGNCLSHKCYARLAALFGLARAKEFLFNPSLLGAEALFLTGALREIVDGEDELWSRAQQIAEELASLAPLTLAATKQALHRIRDRSLPAEGEEAMLKSCYMSDDFKEGVAAFLEKRRPAWIGR